MKKIIYALSLLIGFTACGESEEVNVTETTTTTSEAPAAKVSPDEIIARYDPVCRMENDPAWVDSLDYQGKMVHFCSTTCKNAFEAQPEKYLQ